MENCIGMQDNGVDAHIQSLDDCNALKINKSPMFDDLMSFELQNNPAEYGYEAQMQPLRDFEDVNNEATLEAQQDQTYDLIHSNPLPK